MQQYSMLFSPGQIGSLVTKNRLVMAPMVRNYADERGMVTPKYLAHIDRVARGGVGMMVLDASFVSPEGRGFVHQLGLHTDEAVSGFSQVAEAVHRHRALVGPQLYHAGRQTSRRVTGIEPVAPSAIPDPSTNELPRPLEIDEIHELVDAFARAAVRARDAGCDFVELHGAHGYLINQFLSPFSNARNDDYGGSEENRMRFALDVVHAVREAVGPDFTVTMRISADELVPRGLTLADSVSIARRLEEAGVNAISVSAGNYASFDRGLLIQPMAIPDAPLVHLAEGIKQAVSVPVIAVGKIRTPEIADEVVACDRADFIALGRVLLADPDWPNKAREGRAGEINECIACNQGCITRLFNQQDVWCTVNPETSREQEFAKPAPDTARRVLVAGGGPAGMEAAKMAAERGHDVVLCEELEHLGGQIIAAAAAPFRPGWEELRQYLVSEMSRLGIDVRLRTKATAEIAEMEEAEVAVVAVGARPVRPRIPGIQHENVVIARDILEGNAEAKGRVVVAGGGCAGAQTAEYLVNRGHDVTIVEMLGDIAVDAAVADRELLIERLHRAGVKVLTDTRIIAIEGSKVLLERPSGTEDLPADTVVLCLGSASNDSTAEELQEVVETVVVVGDALDPRKVTEAMVEGARAGLYCEQPHPQEVVGAEATPA